MRLIVIGRMINTVVGQAAIAMAVMRQTIQNPVGPPGYQDCPLLSQQTKIINEIIQPTLIRGFKRINIIGLLVRGDHRGKLSGPGIEIRHQQSTDPAIATLKGMNTNKFMIVFLNKW